MLSVVDARVHFSQGVDAVVASSAVGVVFDGSLLLAAPVALAAGALSFFSPCCLPLLPGYLSYVAGTTGSAVAATADPSASGTGARLGASWGRVMAGCALFVLGFAAVFASYGALFGTFGAVLLIHRTALTRVLGVVTIVLGLAFLGVLSWVPGLNRTFKPSWAPKAGLAGAPLLGMLFGVGWTPCIGPTLGVVMTLSIDSGTAGRGAFLAFVYAVGLGVPFLIGAALFHRTLTAFGFARRRARAVMRVGGAMLIAVGLLQLSGEWTSLIAQMQGLITGFRSPL